MEAILEFCGQVGGFMWGPWTFFVLMGAGILFTLWTRFSQFKALTHGVQVVRGKYDDPDDPGAISHFQALSAALSATVGLGNIGGVALAVAGGGPGAVFWMWIIGFLGMAIKTVEVSLSMLFRDTDDPDDPHGGAMWVVDKVLGSKGGPFKPLAKIFGVTFCITLIISTITGGNMFQSWNVAALTETYFEVPRLVTGIVLAVVVGLVIIGGIKRIGTVAGKLVPFMCVLYLISAFAVLLANATAVPGLLLDIVTSAFSPQEATGAFLGGSIGWAFSIGLRRALFSNEAGQGSAPIAHSAAKTNEPVREGIVSGLEPFIGTICICTLTALVILSTGTWNRDPLVQFETEPVVTEVFEFGDTPIAIDVGVTYGTEVYLKVTPILATNSDGSPRSAEYLAGSVQTTETGRSIIWNEYDAPGVPDPISLEVYTQNMDSGREESTGIVLPEMPVGTRAMDDRGTPNDSNDDLPLWSLLSVEEHIFVQTEREYDEDSGGIHVGDPDKYVFVPKTRDYEWIERHSFFTVFEADTNQDTRSNRHRLRGLGSQTAGIKDAVLVTATDIIKGESFSFVVDWNTIASSTRPRLAPDTGLYQLYEGAQLTAYAFDRQFPGLGKWLVTLAAWLFAISTMISWSYYGEQGVIYMVGRIGVLPYKLAFLALVIIGAVWITDAAVMEPLMDLGTGAMLWANMPIVLLLGFIAVRELDTYFKKLKRGEFHPHAAPSITDVMGGKDVE